MILLKRHVGNVEDIHDDKHQKIFIPKNLHDNIIPSRTDHQKKLSINETAQPNKIKPND